MFINFRLLHMGIGMLVSTFIMLISSGSVLEAATLGGVLKDGAGKPVAGSLVKVRGSDAGISFMVVSQADGRYSTPELLPGKYMVQAIGGTYQSEVTSPIQVSNNQQKVDLILSVARVIPPPDKKMTNTDYDQYMPDGPGKEIVTSKCVMCHGLDRVVPARKTRQAWQLTVNRMAYFLDERPDLGGPLSSDDKKSVHDYLSKNFTRDTPPLPESTVSDPNRYLPATLLEGLESRFITLEFDPKAPVEAPETEFGVDSKGNAWISEGGTAFFGKFDPDTFSYTRFEAPASNFPRGLAQMAVDPDDFVWILDSGPSPNAELLRFDMQTKEFKIYEIIAPQRLRAPLNTLRFLDGNVWGTGNASSRVVKLDTRTGKITAYPATRGGHPFGIAIGGDKAVWYITNYNNEITRINPATGEQKSYQALSPRSGLRRMGADALGNLWAAGQDSNKLVKLNSKTGEVTEYTVPSKDAGPYSVDVDTKNNLVWFSERDTNKLGRFDPSTETFVEFPLPAAGIEARRILVDPVNPNRIWWNCSTGCIGYTQVIE